MSADDGIYILITRGENGQSEFRVTWAQGMDFSYVDDLEGEATEAKPPLTLEFVTEYFEDCTEVIDNEPEAQEIADVMDRDLETELGVRALNYGDIPFPTA